MLSVSFSTTTSTTSNTTSLNNPFLPKFKIPNHSTSKTQNPQLTPKPIIPSNQLSSNLEEPYPNILLNRRNALLGLVTLSTTLPYTPAMAAPSPPTFPRPLASVTRIRVARPAKLRSKEDKEKEEEVLVVKIEQLKEDEVVKFDVYINIDEEDFEEEIYAGSYVALPRPPKPGREKFKTVLNLGLTSLIDDIGADGDDFVDVVLVPRAGSMLLSSMMSRSSSLLDWYSKLLDMFYTNE